MSNLFNQNQSVVDQILTDLLVTSGKIDSADLYNIKEYTSLEDITKDEYAIFITATSNGNKLANSHMVKTLWAKDAMYNSDKMVCESICYHNVKEIIQEENKKYYTHLPDFECIYSKSENSLFRKFQHIRNKKVVAQYNKIEDAVSNMLFKTTLNFKIGKEKRVKYYRPEFDDFLKSKIKGEILFLDYLKIVDNTLCNVDDLTAEINNSRFNFFKGKQFVSDEELYELKTYKNINELISGDEHICAVLRKNNYPSPFNHAHEVALQWSLFEDFEHSTIRNVVEYVVAKDDISSIFESALCNYNELYLISKIGKAGIREFNIIYNKRKWSKHLNLEDAIKALFFTFNMKKKGMTLQNVNYQIGVERKLRMTHREYVELESQRRHAYNQKVSNSQNNELS
ncbi:hypothetical protein AAEX28_01965 [Lentisphaerota bacterium WC36G]|nr:hypothetical protein LJT99_04850 [Lentisphaerae bacterium WC36]